MKQILVMMVVVVLVGCGTTKVSSNVPAKINDPIVEKAIREVLEKPEGELTETDFEKVTFLDFFNTQITNEGLKDLAKLNKLTFLDFFDIQITDEGLKEVAKLNKLAHLTLADNRITDKGLKEVAKLEELDELFLGFNQITDAGLKEVAKLQKLKFL